jgi:hypothetical protein
MGVLDLSGQGRRSGVLLYFWRRASELEGPRAQEQVIYGLEQRGEGGGSNLDHLMVTISRSRVQHNKRSAVAEGGSIRSDTNKARTPM